MNTVTPKWYVGMDVSEKSIEFFFLPPDNEDGIHKSMPNSLDTLCEFCDALPDVRNVVVALETGTHSPWMSEYFENRGVKCFVGNARKLAAVWSSVQKSDRNDDETGLIYYNYRYYNPTMGRWLSRVVSGIMRTFCFADRLSDDFPSDYSASSSRSFFNIHVLSRSPFGGRDMPQPGSDQHQGRVAVLETADHMRSTADLAYDPLQYVIGLPPYPIFRRKNQYGFSSFTSAETNSSVRRLCDRSLPERSWLVGSSQAAATHEAA